MVSACTIFMYVCSSIVTDLSCLVFADDALMWNFAKYYELQREALRAMTVSFGADHPVVQSLAVTSTRRPGYEKFDQQRGATDDGDGVDKWASLGPEKQEEVMTAFASALSRGGK